jgi:hypothetical protein
MDTHVIDTDTHVIDTGNHGNVMGTHVFDTGSKPILKLPCSLRARLYRCLR